MAGCHPRRDRRRGLPDQHLPRGTLPASGSVPGKNRAIVAVGNLVLTIVWHLLANPKARYVEPGSGSYQSKINRVRRERDLVRQLEHLTGKKLTLTPRPQQPAA